LGRDAEIREVLRTISKKLIWLRYFRAHLASVLTIRATERQERGPATGDQLWRTTRLVFTGSNRPERAIDHSTRQAPRVARSQ
jgi:hypothetical protein